MMKAEGNSQKAEVNSFRDLIVWQKSMKLVTDIYKITNHFPESEKFGLINQMRRAAVSVPSNIAEGFGRNSTGDYIRFLQIASGSPYELQTQLSISQNLRFASEDTCQAPTQLAVECERMLSSLISKLKQHLR
tara:strand:- start:1188 stop:1586 length:399 start_codon:yes stop_codon:yes gene_type:complete